MKKQYAKGVQKWKKAYLMIRESKIIIAMLDLLISCKAGQNISTVQRIELKEDENSVLILS